MLQTNKHKKDSKIKPILIKTWIKVSKTTFTRNEIVY